MRRRVVVIVAGLLAVAVAAGCWIRLGPLPDGFLDPSPHRSTVIVDRNGATIYESLSSSETRSEWISPDAIPDAVIEATLAAEDHRFFLHPGLDGIAIVRALWRDLLARRFVQGGSTLTQQLVKQIQIARGDRGARVGVLGKAREAVLALRVEHRLTKREILALYLNLAPYGNQYRGIRRAASGYFGIPVENLTVAQAALLAGLPRRPSVLDPYRHRAAALARGRQVIDRMFALGMIDEATAEIAAAERLAFARPRSGFDAPHFVERVLDAEGEGNPARIETTLDLPLQREVKAIIDAKRPQLDRHGARNVAVAVLDNRTGDWLAWEGSGNWFDDAHGGTIDGVVTPRQPGSALKPFVYAVAFDGDLTPASVLPDIPSTFPTAVEGVSYVPRNYDGVFRGPLRARKALAGSENVPAVWLADHVGVGEILRMLRAAGFTTFERNADYYGLGIVLGDAEVRLDEMVAGYAALARGGRWLAPRMIGGGAAREPADANGVRVVSERSAFWIGDVLSDSRAREYIFGRGGSLDFPFRVAVKTGTSQAYHDNWTIGFTRDVTVGVWVGNFDRTPLRNSTGVTGAAPIFHDVMLAAVTRIRGTLPVDDDAPIVEVPADFVRRPICALSGMDAGELCPVVESEWFPRDAPIHICDWHGENRAVRWPSEYVTWARGRGLLARAATRVTDVGEVPLTIASPPAGAVYLFDSTLRREFQALELRANAGAGSRMLSWTVDGKRVGRSRSDEPVAWPMTRGKHRIEVTDDRGRVASTSIEVR